MQIFFLGENDIVAVLDGAYYSSRHDIANAIIEMRFLYDMQVLEIASNSGTYYVLYHSKLLSIIDCALGCIYCISILCGKFK